MKINGNDLLHSSFNTIAPGEYATVGGAGADSNDPLRPGSSIVGSLQCFPHVFCHRACDHEHVGMAWRGHKSQPESLEIIESIGQRVDFQLATVAGAGINLAN